jgi:hypothetical protein
MDEDFDSNDAKNGGLSGLGDTLLGIGGRVVNNLTTKPAQNRTVVQQPAASSGSAWTKYLPWILGGTALLAVLGFVFAGSRGR